MRDTSSRVAWLTGLVAVALILLAVQLYRISLVQSAYWQAQGVDQMQRSLPSYGPRGAIYDAKGRALATSEPAFAAVLINQDTAAVEKMMPQLALLLTEGDQKRAEELAADVLAQFRENKRLLEVFKPITVGRRLSPQLVAALTERSAEFPGVVLMAESARTYPQGALAGALVGYVRVIGEELEDPDYKEYNEDELVGKAGLELSYEKQLRGQPGHLNVTINPLGRRVGDFDETPPVPGNSLHLTLDLELQKVAEEALRKQIEWIKQKNDPHAKPVRGSAVVQNVRTGAVLAMASVPTYDPNIMVKDLTAAEWERIQNEPGFSMYNWAIQGLSPGSTFKMATGYAGLEAGVIGPYETIPCPAVYWRYNNPKNWKGYDDGYQNVSRALATSCNPFFWETSYRLGIEKMHYYYDLLGFGRRTGVDLPLESPGRNPDQAYYGDQWWPGHILNLGIGQGDNLVTPLQLANYTAAIAMKGVRYQPYLVQEVKDASGQTVMRREPKPMEVIPGKEDTWNILRQGMWQAANTPEGTAYLPLLGFPIKAGGKTGSAERGAVADATTVVFAPYDDPQIAISVVIEGGSTGSWATPVARRIMAQYFGIKDVMPEGVPTYRD